MTIVQWGNIGIMENKTETIIVYWGNTGIMEKKEATIMGLPKPSFKTQRPC